MSNLKAVLTFDDSWDDEAVRNAFADNDQFPGVTLAEVTSTECGVCARQNKGSAEQQTDNSGSIKFICPYCGGSRGQFDHYCPSCGKSLLSRMGK